MTGATMNRYLVRLTVHRKYVGCAMDQGILVCIGPPIAVCEFDGSLWRLVCDAAQPSEGAINTLDQLESIFILSWH